MGSKKRTKQNLFSNIYNFLIRETFIPLFLMITTPNLTVILSYIIVNKESNLIQTLLSLNKLQNTLINAWTSVDWFDRECWTVIGCLLLWGILSLHLPGKSYNGPITSNGFIPIYWHTGFRFYIISMFVVIPLILKYPILQFYYKIPTFNAILAVFGFVFCALLYLKGLFLPSKGLHNRTKNPIFDYYWGIELYPHLGPIISLKLLIICRFGLILWQFIVLICFKANYEIYGTINYSLTATTLLQTFYLAKFYYWEDGYMNTIDTAVDRFGYYVCWGCIAFVPGFYPITSLYLVENSPYNHFGFKSCLVSLICGLLIIGLNYWSDQQKLEFRSKNGKCVIWGKPAKLIRAQYTDDFGKTKHNILLTSGFWGITRHMNYTFELISTLLWCLPALFSSPIPYFYFIFLTILLVHRSVRDDNKCMKKYGKYWESYKKIVKYQMIPYIY